MQLIIREFLESALSSLYSTSFDGTISVTLAGANTLVEFLIDDSLL